MLEMCLPRNLLCIISISIRAVPSPALITVWRFRLDREISHARLKLPKRVFEGEITEAQLFDIKKLLQEGRAKDSSIIVYEFKEPKNVKRTIIGDAKGNRSNVI